MKTYLDLLDHVLTHGVRKEDRTAPSQSSGMVHKSAPTRIASRGLGAPFRRKRDAHPFGTGTKRSHTLTHLTRLNIRSGSDSVINSQGVGSTARAQAVINNDRRERS